MISATLVGAAAVTGALPRVTVDATLSGGVLGHRGRSGHMLFDVVGYIVEKEGSAADLYVCRR